MKTLVENVITVHEAHKSRTAGFELPNAVASVISQGHNGITVTTLASAGDVYDLLGLIGLMKADKFEADALGLAIDTTGWAAPLGNGGEVQGLPSQHPERRRVRLTAMVGKLGTASCIEFSDDEGEYITDEGQATGSLADALAEAWAEFSA